MGESILSVESLLQWKDTNVIEKNVQNLDQNLRTVDSA
jgi:hypothetical protein